MESEHGVYMIRLPLLNGQDAVLAGVCLDRITNTFPLYPIQGRVKEDIYKAFEENNFAVTITYLSIFRELLVHYRFFLGSVSYDIYLFFYCIVLLPFLMGSWA